MPNPLPESPIMPQEYRPYWIDKRAEPRLHLHLAGTISFPDGSDLALHSRDVSRSGMAVIAPARPAPGLRVNGIFEEIGIIAGRVARWTPDGFAIRFMHDAAHQARLCARLDTIEAAGGRRPLGGGGFFDSRIPQQRAGRYSAPDLHLMITLPDGRIIAERLRDISRSGASVISRERPSLGAGIRIRDRDATVIRHTPDGFAVRFEGVEAEHGARGCAP
ncbi:PilZ domain-containing protein [Saliniramus fredricksonii]|nr:PilZ domain-containing protein [Saliniramus fredricksonii]